MSTQRERRGDRDASHRQTLGVLEGGGEMGALMRSMDWSETPLGPPGDWPHSLRTAISILLNSRYPMFVFWGEHLVKIYNDGYRPITGAKHPWALGRPATEVWPEIWDTIGPMVERVVERGEATWSDDLLLFMERNGFPEEVYFTFSYSPIRDETGGVGGLFCACTETTEKVLGERRLRTLHDLAAGPAEARTARDACRLSSAVLESNAADVPFSLLYLFEDHGLRLVSTSGVEPGAPIAPEHVALEGDGGGWPLAAVLESGEPQLVSSLASRFSRLPAGPWPEPPERALALPLLARGLERPAGIIVLGVSSRRTLDELYSDFLSLVAGQIATSIDNARASEQERRRAEALAEIDRAKTAFFSNVSHEFRTPLTLMLGHLEDLLRGARGALSGEVRRDVEVTHRNALRLVKLVNTLLDFSRIEAGRAAATYQPTDLPRLTCDLASVFRSAVERAGLRLEVDCPPLDEPIFVDRDMWEKIVLNLLSNAFKFTFEGEIAVSLRAAERRVELSVRDTGTGIPAAERPRLFERFHRIHGARSRTHEGSGIGLALVRELVELHGGAIRVEGAEGEGTEMIVSIPSGSEHLPPDQIGEGEELPPPERAAAPFVEEALSWLPDGEEAGDPEPVPPADAEPPRVLLADDNADMRAYVERLLAGRYRVEAVSNGAQALAAARARPPDLVLTDVMMPELDGFGLLRALRSDPATRGVPVVMLSARAGEESTLEGLEQGADDYLTKPFSARELIARIESQLALAAMRDEARGEREARLEDLERQVHFTELFVGVLGHDLRTPLSAITFAAEILRQRVDDPHLQSVVERLARSSQRMARMIDQILDFTRVRMGTGLPIERTQTNLAAVCRHVLEELRGHLDTGDVTLRIEGDTEGRWDPDRLAQLVSNLLGNALEHRSAGTPVAIRLDGTDSAVVRFDIFNHGVVAQPDLAVIFEPFHSGREQSEGLGLGLYISREIARAHGGDIELESSEERGTRFVATLPR